MDEQRLTKLVTKNLPKYKNGTLASYIPALSKVNPQQLGITIYFPENNTLISAGQSQTQFAIESISKVPALLMALEDNGIDEVFRHIKTEPSTFSFNSIMNMEISHSNRPLNPFVNAGAIKTTSLIAGIDFPTKKKRILNFMQKICDNPNISVNEEVYESETLTGDMNRSLAYYMKGHGMLEDDATAVLDLYFWQCSLNVTTVDLAKMASVLAHQGIAPWSGEQIITKQAATIVKSLMLTAGMYNESGQFSIEVGVPAKSGVGGGLMAPIPNKCGIGIFGPALDFAGNSSAGMALLQDLVQEMNLNIFA